MRTKIIIGFIYNWRFVTTKTIFRLSSASTLWWVDAFPTNEKPFIIGQIYTLRGLMMHHPWATEIREINFGHWSNKDSNPGNKTPIILRSPRPVGGTAQNFVLREQPHYSLQLRYFQLLWKHLKFSLSFFPVRDLRFFSNIPKEE